MKKVRFFVGMMMAVMTLSFQSCAPSSDNDGNNEVSQLIVAVYSENSVREGCLYDVNGTKIISDDANAIYKLASSDYGLYQFTILYDPTTVADGQVTCTFVSDPASIMNPYGVVARDYVTDDNYPLYAVDGTSSNLYPALFANRYLLVPVLFRSPSIVSTTEYEAELSLHRFVLTYEPINDGDDTLNLWLTDKVSDPETSRMQRTFTNQGFDLRNLISQFPAGTLKKIVISAKVNQASNNIAYEESRTESYTIEIK